MLDVKAAIKKILVAIKEITRNPVSITVYKSPYSSPNANMSYTGVSFTVPANCFFVVTAKATYANVQPSNVAINNSSTNANATLATGAYSPVMSSCSLAGKSGSSSMTLYLWAKYAGANSHAGSVYLEGFYLKEKRGGGLKRLNFNGFRRSFIREGVAVC